MELELFGDPVVQDWQWQIASEMRRRVEESLAGGANEIKCVEAMVEAIAGTTPTSGRLPEGAIFELSVESVFMHGQRSQVRFTIGDTQHQRELADLLVLSTYVEDGTLRYQRVCFIQTKRAVAGRRSVGRYAIDTWQLALLNTFPPFVGVAGLLAGPTIHLRNRSGALGAYGLLSPPGELALVSARVLNHVLGGRTSLTARTLAPAMLSELGAMRYAPGIASDRGPRFDLEHCPECAMLVKHVFAPGSIWTRHHQGHLIGHARSTTVPLDSVLTCIGLDEFVQAWTELRLGELWHAASSAQSDAVLRQCVTMLVRRLHRATGGLPGLTSLLSHADGESGDHQLPKSDRANAQDLGIVSLVVSLSPGQDQVDPSR